jgi:hypothetical protein
MGEVEGTTVVSADDAVDVSVDAVVSTVRFEQELKRVRKASNNTINWILCFFITYSSPL